MILAHLMRHPATLVKKAIRKTFQKESSAPAGPVSDAAEAEIPPPPPPHWQDHFSNPALALSGPIAAEEIPVPASPDSAQS